MALCTFYFCGHILYTPSRWIAGGIKICAVSNFINTRNFFGGGMIWVFFYIWKGIKGNKGTSYIPLSFFGGGIQILSKINFRNLKKIYISCKSTFIPFDPFSYIKKNPNHPPSKKISGINKIWYGTYFYTPRTSGKNNACKN
jgi:hypothetical protein